MAGLEKPLSRSRTEDDKEVTIQGEEVTTISSLIEGEQGNEKEHIIL